LWLLEPTRAPASYERANGEALPAAVESGPRGNSEMHRKITGLTSIKLRLLGDGTRVRLLFRFGEKKSHPDVDVEIAAGDAIALMIALQKLQAENRIPIPASLRPRGKPLASRVLSDGATS
jgi:hypothetical protein